VARRGSVPACLLFVFITATTAVVISQLLVMAVIVSKYRVVASLSLLFWINLYQTEVKVHTTVSRIQFLFQAFLHGLEPIPIDKHIYLIMSTYVNSVV
jgi:hypothetical protein